MILLGAAFVLVPAAMWPSVPLVVEEKRVGTAFGLMTAIQNIGLGLFPLLNGKLRDATGTYTATEIMFACSAWQDSSSPSFCSSRIGVMAASWSRERTNSQPE